MLTGLGLWCSRGGGALGVREFVLSSSTFFFGGGGEGVGVG